MDQMATQIRETLDDVTDVTFQVEGRMILNPTPPTIDIYPGDPSRGTDSAGYEDILGEHLFTVRARVNPTDNEANQDLLLDLMDDEHDLSIPAALYTDETLAGTVTGLDVRNVSGFVLVPMADGTGVHIGCLWTVAAIPARS
jgi:hypothetical protein